MSEKIVLKGIYQIGKKIKEDQFGTIYEVIHLQNKSIISAREYHQRFCHSSIVDKLQHSIYQLAVLNHPNIVKIIDSEFYQGQRFFIIYNSPYEGTLGDVLEKIDKFPIKETLDIISPVIKAIEYAHQKKVIHGTINLDNILILADGQIKVTNFFIDHLLNTLALNKNNPLSNSAYLAPEQLKGARLNKTTDVYALGALLYRMLSGHSPYPEIENIAMSLRNRQRKPESLILRNPSLPKHLEDIIFKALETAQKYRHQSVLELLGDLNARKVTIRVEELKMREQLEKKRQKTPPPIEPKHEIYIPPIKNNRQNVQDSYNYQKKNQEQQPMNKTIKQEPVKKTKRLKDFFNTKKVISIILIVSFVGIAIAIIQSLFVSYFTSIPKVEIPQLAGLSYEEATTELEALGLKHKIAGYIADTNISQNYIVSTMPRNGRVVKKYRLVKLFISKGETESNVPDLIESNVDSIRETLIAKGFKLKIASKIYSKEYPNNIIISQDPEPNTSAKKGTEIAITVSKGYPVFMSLTDKNDDTVVVKLSVHNLESWEPQNVFIYLQDSSGRHKYAEKMLAPGEKLIKDITTEQDAIIEVYYFDNLAFKQEIKYLD